MAYQLEIVDGYRLLGFKRLGPVLYGTSPAPLWNFPYDIVIILLRLVLQTVCSIVHSGLKFVIGKLEYLEFRFFSRFIVRIIAVAGSAAGATSTGFSIWVRIGGLGVFFFHLFSWCLRYCLSSELESTCKSFDLRFFCGLQFLLHRPKTCPGKEASQTLIILLSDCYETTSTVFTPVSINAFILAEALSSLSTLWVLCFTNLAFFCNKCPVTEDVATYHVDRVFCFHDACQTFTDKAIQMSALDRPQ